MFIIGHQKILDYFSNAINKATLSHAYCFVGPNQVGKRTAARYIAAELLNVEDKKLETHPDFIFVSRLQDEKTGKMKKDIGISQSRDLKERIARKSWLGGYQVIIIDEAELLNEESGNALLKVLEDSAGQKIFFLLTTNDYSMLATVKSRCQLFFFNIVGNFKIQQALMERGIDKDTAEQCARMSWGRPGMAIAMAANLELRSQYLAEQERWEKITTLPLHKKLKMVENLLEDTDDSTRVSDKLKSVLELWIMFAREEIYNARGSSTHLPANKIREIIDEMKNARLLLGQNINPRMVVEGVLLKL